MSMPAPAAGRVAPRPGYGVVESTRTTAAAMSARPADGQLPPWPVVAGARDPWRTAPIAINEPKRDLPGSRRQRVEGPRGSVPVTTTDGERATIAPSPRRPRQTRARANEPETDEQEQRPEQVELLLDAERPEVQDREGGASAAK